MKRRGSSRRDTVGLEPVSAGPSVVLKPCDDRYKQVTFSFHIETRVTRFQSSMPRGHSKHLTKKERKSLQADFKDVKGEPVVNIRVLRAMSNALIDKGSATLERSMNVLKAINETLDKPITIVPCFFCGKKLGLKRCSGCLDKVYYCSIQCQTEDWPTHRLVCSSRQIIDVD